MKETTVDRSVKTSAKETKEVKQEKAPETGYPIRTLI